MRKVCEANQRTNSLTNVMDFSIFSPPLYGACFGILCRESSYVIVQVKRISNSVPFVVKGEVDVAAFDAFMKDNEEECRARSPITYDVTLKQCREGIRFEAAIHADLFQDCVRCNKRDETTFEIKAEFLLVDIARSPQDEEIILGADDLDVSFYENGEIDVDHLILESLWSELDSLHLCKEDCRGLCPRCGKNLNDGYCGCSKSSF